MSKDPKSFIVTAACYNYGQTPNDFIAGLSIYDRESGTFLQGVPIETNSVTELGEEIKSYVEKLGEDTLSHLRLCSPAMYGNNSFFKKGEPGRPLSFDEFDELEAILQ